MRTPTVIIPDTLTPEQFARKLGIPRKRFLVLKAFTDKFYAENAHKYLHDGSHSDSTPLENGTTASAAVKPKPAKQREGFSGATRRKTSK